MVCPRFLGPLLRRLVLLFGRAGGALEPAGRVFARAGGALEPAGRVFARAGGALEPAGRVFAFAFTGLFAFFLVAAAGGATGAAAAGGGALQSSSRYCLIAGFVASCIAPFVGSAPFEHKYLTVSNAPEYAAIVNGVNLYLSSVSRGTPAMSIRYFVMSKYVSF